VVDNRLPAPSRYDPLDFNLQPCCGVALPVAGATPRRSPEMKPHVLPILTLMLYLMGCKEDSVAPALDAVGIASEISGSESVFVSRNFPGSPLGGMKRMSPDLHLGRAYATEASDRWLKLIQQLKPASPKNTLPVLFAEIIVFGDGKPQLVVGQLQCTMTGDGFFSPGAVFSCALYTIDISTPAKPVILWEGLSALGTLQNSRIVRIPQGSDAPNKVTVTEEVKESEERVVRTCLIFSPSDGYSIAMERKAVE
jgi:hypothetical protein